MDTSVSDDNWGVQNHRIFHGGYCDYRRTFQTVLDLYRSLCNGVNIAEIDTSLSNIIEACATIMMRNAWVYQSVNNILFAKKVNKLVS